MYRDWHFIMKEVERIMQSGVYVSKLLSIKYIVFLTVELAMIMDRLYGGCAMQASTQTQS